jgi:hypothetical protein
LDEISGTIGTYGGKRDAYRVWVETLKERDHCKGKDGRIILMWILNK